MRRDLGLGSDVRFSFRADDRDWKAAQGELQKTKPVDFHPGKVLWGGSWFNLETSVVDPVVKGGLRESGQEWALVACLTDNLNIIVAAMMGWSFPFSLKMESYHARGAMERSSHANPEPGADRQAGSGKCR